MLLGNWGEFKENLNWHLRQGFKFHPVVWTQWNQRVYDEALLFFKFVNLLSWGAIYEKQSYPENYEEIFLSFKRKQHRRR